MKRIAPAISDVSAAKKIAHGASRAEVTEIGVARVPSASVVAFAEHQAQLAELKGGFRTNSFFIEAIRENSKASERR